VPSAVLGAAVGAFTLLVLLSTLLICAYGAYLAPRLETRVVERTAALDQSSAQLRRSIRCAAGIHRVDTTTSSEVLAGRGTRVGRRTSRVGSRTVEAHERPLLANPRRSRVPLLLGDAVQPVDFYGHLTIIGA
jgi:hypothetical protein